VIRKKDGPYELLKMGGSGVFPRTDVYTRVAREAPQVDWAVRREKTHEDSHTDALRRWLLGCDEALEEWLEV
jgi:hypothetical protein